MATYCEHSNAPVRVRYERKKERRKVLQADLDLSCTFCLMSDRVSDVISRSRYSERTSVTVSRSFWLFYTHHNSVKYHTSRFNRSYRLENLLDWKSGERCLHQAFQSNSGIVWPWSLTTWPPKLTVSSPCTIDHLHQFVAKLVHLFSK